MKYSSFFLNNTSKIHATAEKIATLNYFTLMWFDCYFRQRIISILSDSSEWSWSGFAWMHPKRVFHIAVDMRRVVCMTFDLFELCLVHTLSFLTIWNKCFAFHIAHELPKNAWCSGRNLKHTYVSSERLHRIDCFFHKNWLHLSLSAMSLSYDVRINTWNRKVMRRKCW